MIASMTGYAFQEFQKSWGTLSWELRSVNHRFLDLNLKLPESFKFLDPDIKSFLKKRVSRGKIEIILRLNLLNNISEEISIDEQMLDNLIQSIHHIKTKTQCDGINPLEILKYPGIIKENKQNIDELTSDINDSLSQALNSFLENRKAEGQKIKDSLIEKLSKIELETQKINKAVPEIIEAQKQKIKIRLEELNLKLDEDRIEQEIVLLAQKIDIQEELDRLGFHVSEAKNILNKGGLTGRKLDFLMQEFNRESNTIASKSINKDVTKSAVELKVLIEQIREQIQNLE